MVVMQQISKHKVLGRIGAIYMMVALLFVNFPTAAFADGLSVNLSVNGSHGPVTLNSGDTYTYAWSSNGATSCQMTAPTNSGIPLLGSDGPIDSTFNLFYPTATAPVTLTVTCTDGTNTASDSVTVSLAAPAALPTADIKANGSDGLVTIHSGDTYTYSWSSTNATSCNLTSPTNSGIPLLGSDGPIDSTFNLFYPTASSSVTLTITCTDAASHTATDSVVVSLSGSTPTGTLPNADIKANGSDGPVVISAGDTYTYSWTSSNATSCTLTSPTNSGIPLLGSDGPIDHTFNLFYPTVNAPVTLTITCTDGTHTATDSVVVSIGSTPTGTLPTADIKANGSDGPVTINQGDSYTYSWTSANASSCKLVAPTNSGIPLVGSDGPIDSTFNLFYPTASSSVTLTINCTDGTNTAIDSVVVGLASSTIPTGTLPTVDVKANGSDGPITINQGDSYTYTWTSANATSCQMVSPTNSGVTLQGTDGPIDQTFTYFYPTISAPVTITIKCTDGVHDATDSVVINLATNGGGGGCTLANINSSLSVTYKINEPFSYTITTTNASSSPVFTVDTANLPAGLTFSTTTATISGTPTVSGNYSIKLTSTNTCGTDTETLSLAPETIFQGGGGGPLPTGGEVVLSPGGGHHAPVSNDLACLYVKDYMRKDFNNDPEQVMRLQSFLKVIEGYNYVTVNGVFDTATENAVDAFQMQFKDDILTPWGHTAPTGYVYILTLKKINEIYCLNSFPLNDAQTKEIASFRALLEGLRNQGLNVELVPGATTISNIDTQSTTSPIELPIVGQITPQGQNLSNLAAVIFAGPASLLQALQCIYEFLLILIVLYILGSVLEDVLIKDVPENVLKKFLVKWTTVSFGLTIAIIAAYVLGEWCLTLPLLIALIISLLWMALYPKHDSIVASTKSKYLIITARSKSLWNKAGSVTETSE
jgi:hypothetical protein